MPLKRIQRIPFPITQVQQVLTVLATTTVICPTLTATGSNSPVCEMNTLNLRETGGSATSWSGPMDLRQRLKTQPSIVLHYRQQELTQ